VGERVLVDRDGPVRIVTLNRPEKLNAADRAMQEDFASVWPSLAAEPDAAVVVVTGSGRAFSAGGDFSFLQAVTGRPVEDELAEALHAATVGWMEGVLTVPMPVIAAVNGPAIGFGAAVVAACDLVVIAEDGYLCEPHVTYGLPPSPAIELLWPRLTSMQVSKELTMTGRRLGADEAARVGLANRVVPAGTAKDAAVAWAHELAMLDRQGLALAKETHNRPVLDAMRTRAGEWGRANGAGHTADVRR
jgi:enoyl-CoA hydratase